MDGRTHTTKPVPGRCHSSYAVLCWPQILEKGSHDDLMQLPDGEYRQMWERQMEEGAALDAAVAAEAAEEAGAGAGAGAGAASGVVGPGTPEGSPTPTEGDMVVIDFGSNNTNGHGHGHGHGHGR